MWHRDSIGIMPMQLFTPLRLISKSRPYMIVTHQLNNNFWLSSLIDYDGVRLCLRTAATNGSIHPPGDMWAWRVTVVMMPAGDNSWFVHQSSLAVLPAETNLGQVGGMVEGVWILPTQYLRYLKGPLTCRKILQHGTSGFTSHPKESVLQIFIALKNPSPRPGLNPWPLGPVASTPLRRPDCLTHDTTAVHFFQKYLIHCLWNKLAVWTR
jgi:hypothetical protein